MKKAGIISAVLLALFVLFYFIIRYFLTSLLSMILFISLAVSTEEPPEDNTASLTFQTEAICETHDSESRNTVVSDTKSYFYL